MRPACAASERAVKTVTGKVGAVDRTHVTAESALQRTRDVATLKETLAKAERSPQAKAPRPMTVSQEVGWFWREAEREPDFLHSTQKVCDEVKYASVYYETFHCGPFSRTQTVAR
ncbi:hypothetical protein EON67_11040 [archaeon]|nr:MAG: hypothetical protein EON67_11040 [archaeon]